ncbi:MAG: DUF433 domain-containing protein [Acidobacteria bacterium]|nr:DUF433 domain-containing protein [Acidobacteriota bacterium]
MADVIAGRISKDPGVCGGKACIAGHRVRVWDIVVWHEHMGMSADEIVAQIPTITLSDVHTALAYYFDHMEEIRAETRQEADYAGEFMRNHPSALQVKLQKMLGDKAR